MTTSKTHIEDMQKRVDEIAKREQLLIATLNQALAEADRRLLDEVRTVTIEHEARRTIILTELQSLAARIGAFPISGHTVPEQIGFEEADLAVSPPDNTAPKTTDEPSSPKGADWRKATQNIPPDYPDHFELDIIELGQQAIHQDPAKSRRTA